MGTTSIHGNVGRSESEQAQRPAVDPTKADAELSYIAGCTARDHSVKVINGEPGGGSYANLESKLIVLDAEHSDTEPEFIAAHEGAHIGETVSPKALGRTPEQIREIAGKIGLHPLLNVVEDGAIGHGSVTGCSCEAGQTTAPSTTMAGIVATM